MAHHLKTLAFPCISTGVYRFPKGKAAGIALREIGDFLVHHTDFEKITAVCFEEEDYRLYRQLVKKMGLES